MVGGEERRVGPEVGVQEDDDPPPGDPDTRVARRRPAAAGLRMIPDGGGTARGPDHLGRAVRGTVVDDDDLVLVGRKLLGL